MIDDEKLKKLSIEELDKLINQSQEIMKKMIIEIKEKEKQIEVLSSNQE